MHPFMLAKYFHVCYHRTNLKKKERIILTMKNSINQKGITLIALVVTIVILLILAGVSISMFLGNNRSY